MFSLSITVVVGGPGNVDAVVQLLSRGARLSFQVLLAHHVLATEGKYEESDVFLVRAKTNPQAGVIPCRNARQPRLLIMVSSALCFKYRLPFTTVRSRVFFFSGQVC